MTVLVVSAVFIPIALPFIRTNFTFPVIEQQLGMGLLSIRIRKTSLSAPVAREVRALRKSQKSQVLVFSCKAMERAHPRSVVAPSCEASASWPRPLRPSLHQLFNERACHIRGHPGVATDQRSFVQHRLGPVKGGNVGAFEEFPDRDHLAPE